MFFKGGREEAFTKKEYVSRYISEANKAYDQAAWSDAITDTEDAGDQTGNDSTIEAQAFTHDCIVEYALFHSGELLVTSADS